MCRVELLNIDNATLCTQTRNLPARMMSAVASEPANSVYHYHLGFAYSKNGDRPRARASLKQALDLKPAFSDAKQALIVLGD